MSNRGSDTALAFLLGLVAGGVTALLLAPDRGSETRRKLREGAGGLREKAGTKAHHLADATRAKVDHVAESTRSQIGAVRGAVAEGREAYRREMATKEGE